MKQNFRWVSQLNGITEWENEISWVIQSNKMIGIRNETTTPDQLEWNMHQFLTLSIHQFLSYCKIKK